MDKDEKARYSILIMEDEPILGKVCRRILEAEGYKIIIAGDGIDAKEKLEKNKFDFCLSDIKTPLMNGMELFAFLQVKYPALASHTVFMTGDFMNKNIQDFLKKTDVPCLFKPFTDQTLVETVEKYLK